MRFRVRTLSLFLVLAPTVAWGQGVAFSVSGSPTDLSAGGLPNTDWAATPFENAPPTYPDDDDWEWAGSFPLRFYLVPEVGATFAAIDATVTWDRSALRFLSAELSGGMFDEPDGVAFTLREGGGDVRINASRLDNQNVTAASGDYVVQLDFLLRRPGQTALGLTGLDVRTVDGVGGQGAVAATATAGILRAYLGDVASLGDETSGDGVVDFEDLIVFTEAYYAGTSVVGGSLDRYKVKLDLGPTADGSVFTAPQIDEQIEFEDLIIFALSYARSQQGVYPRLADPSPVALRVGEATRDGGDLVVPVRVEGAVDLRAFALEARIDPAYDLVEARAAEDGPGRGLFVTGQAADGALFVDGASLTAEAVSGSGELQRVRLRPRPGTAPRPGVALTGARLRTSRNVPIPARLDAPPAAPAPDEAGLALPSPNPARGAVALRYELAEAGPVVIGVFDPLGRRVAALVDGPRGAGAHEARWDAAGYPPGTYLVRLQAGALHQTRTLTVLP